MLITKTFESLAKFSGGNLMFYSSASAAVNSSYIHRRGSQVHKFINVGQLLERTAEKIPDREAVVSCNENSRITFAEALEKVKKFDEKIN